MGVSMTSSQRRDRSRPPRSLISYALRAVGLYVPFETGKRTLIRKYIAASLDRSRSVHQVRVRRGGIEFELDLGEEIEVWIFLSGWWEKRDFKAALANLRDSQVVLDVGANVGLFALHAARAVGSRGRVYAFEPNPSTHRRLVRNVKINALTNLEVRRTALGDRNGDADLFLPKPGVAGGATLLQGWRDIVDQEAPWDTNAPGEDVLPVRLSTLDRFCEEHGVEQIDYVKIDVEGAEPAVLLGGERTIRRHRPSLLVECNRSALTAGGWTVGRFLELLWDFGYETRKMRRFGQSLSSVTSVADVHEELCNLHCRPSTVSGRA